MACITGDPFWGIVSVMWYGITAGLRLLLLFTCTFLVSGMGIALSKDKPFQVAQSKHQAGEDEDEKKKRLQKLRQKREQLHRQKEQRKERQRTRRNDREQGKRRRDDERRKADQNKREQQKRFKAERLKNQLERKRQAVEQKRRQFEQRNRNKAVREREIQNKRRAFEENRRNQQLRKQVERRKEQQQLKRLREERQEQRKLQRVQERRKAFEKHKREEFRRAQARPEKRKQFFNQERLKRREARKRFQEQLRRRDKSDLRKLRKRREIIRRNIARKYNKKLRRRQLQAAKERLEFRRKRDRLRAGNGDIRSLREELKRKRRQRIVGRGGRLIDFSPREYRYRKHRYRDLGRRRYRNGLHIYLTPPVGAFIAWNLYMIDGTGSSLREVEDVFDSPLAVDLDEVYSVNEVIEDPEIRRKVRSVNLDAITFPSGSSEITEEQLETLDNVAQAIANIIERKPRELFLIEGHTDAVGEEDFNQTLSEDRAAAVKDALIVQYGIPEQNLIDVGYGEEFLKIDTPDDEEENRRVAIRNISPLVGQQYSRRNR